MGQYNPSFTLVPQPEQKRDRDNWQPIPANAFHEGSLTGEALWRTLEIFCAAVRKD